MPTCTIRIEPGNAYRLGIYRLKLLANAHGRLSLRVEADHATVDIAQLTEPARKAYDTRQRG